MKRRHLSIRLLKQDMLPSEALKDVSTCASYELVASLPFKGNFFISNQVPRPPKWLEFIQPNITSEISRLYNMSSGAVLFIESNNRYFALTYGTGYHLLKSDSYESDFGLKVTLNTVDADKVRSIDAHTIDESIMTVRRQSSKSTMVETFGLDIHRDLVRTVTGTPRDPALAACVAGSDGLTLKAKLDFPDLGEKCSRLLQAYGEETYKERFGWIDKLKPVKDPSKIDELNAVLLQKIQNKEYEKLYLAPPEVVDWHDIEGFYFAIPHRSSRSDADNPEPEIQIEKYWEYYPDTNQISLESLKHADKAVMIYGAEFKKEWHIYKCLVFETLLGGDLYVLCEGNWYKVAGDFLSEINEVLDGIKKVTLPLPDAQKNETEGGYNERVAQTVPGLILMDKRNIGIQGHGKIESCDLFTTERQFIHVKKRSTSSTLSHLFAQGKVSAITFLGYKEFRKKFKKMVAETNPALAASISEDSVASSDYEVVYAIITSVREEEWWKELPFFSRLNLSETYKELRMIGYNVALQKINKERG